LGGLGRLGKAAVSLRAQTEELLSSLVSLALLKGSLVWNRVSFLTHTTALRSPLRNWVLAHTGWEGPYPPVRPALGCQPGAGAGPEPAAAFPSLG